MFVSQHVCIIASVNKAVIYDDNVYNLHTVLSYNIHMYPHVYLYLYVHSKPSVLLYGHCFVFDPLRKSLYAQQRNFLKQTAR